MPDPSALAAAILKRAKAHGLKLATAESCTAGALATLLADAPGAGGQFHGGFVVYSKEQKSAVLGVPPELIAAHTAVSRPVAEAMARGVIERCPADLAIAITGVAGPERDEDNNPVGLMHIAVARRGGDVLHRRYLLGADDDPGVLRARTMEAALALAEEVLQEGSASSSTRAVA
jgi:nicotinamide-nucleotide amidase